MIKTLYLVLQAITICSTIIFCNCSPIPELDLSIVTPYIIIDTLNASSGSSSSLIYKNNNETLSSIVPTSMSIENHFLFSSTSTVSNSSSVSSEMASTLETNSTSSSSSLLNFQLIKNEVNCSHTLTNETDILSEKKQLKTNNENDTVSSTEAPTTISDLLTQNSILTFEIASNGVLKCKYTYII